MLRVVLLITTLWQLIWRDIFSLAGPNSKEEISKFGRCNPVMCDDEVTLISPK